MAYWQVFEFINRFNCVFMFDLNLSLINYFTLIFWLHMGFRSKIKHLTDKLPFYSSDMPCIFIKSIRSKGCPVTVALFFNHRNYCWIIIIYGSFISWILRISWTQELKCQQMYSNYYVISVYKIWIPQIQGPIKTCASNAKQIKYTQN